LCSSGTEEELQLTHVTQPAIVATSLAIWEVLRGSGFSPAAVAGHSLGEFAALAAAGVISAEQTLLLVARRGELMAEVAAAVSGAMVAVIGLPAVEVEKLCAAAPGAEIASYNEPEQVVVSGDLTAVAEVGRRAMAAGAEKCVPLKVGAPFHCSLMNAIADEFGAELDRHRFADPQIPVISSVSAQYLRSGEEARILLRRQLNGSVYWVGVVRAAIERGCSASLEIGPGRALTGFAKRIAPDTPAYGTGNPKSLAAALNALAAADAISS
jgi:[acyl-carrier-protein] S-malonyltransferase